SGAANLAASSDASFEELRAMVTSKGGTTARAIEAFEAGDLRGLIGRAVEACIARSREMAELYK
ncbi:MAG: pyrroline-5-carboxylate reductase dimerization domain-containing protein, partial [Duodenibacillus sp.]|nr:pyrroline-5-carboxylate reductase dimerization domain-containing protein [Duodenibacillus sp.]